MRKMRVLALVREGLVPPASLDGYGDKEIAEWKMEFDVITSLRELGHEVQVLGVFDDLSPIRQAIRKDKPNIVFMLADDQSWAGTSVQPHPSVPAAGALPS